MSAFKFAAAALVAACFSQTASAACYVVYSPAKEIIYRAPEPPVDMSFQVHEVLPRVAPGSTLVFTLDNYGCDLRINELPRFAPARMTGPGGRRAPRADRG
ncbi:hypothetical protein LJR118_001667 [Acidovorax sp. LjRoot118]|jgi:hypothetical protein|uniref:hypothetical protein n=1 Tax=unclassified Acidovorax TaxID=2684926 RepID=UPI00070E2B2A|nr:MULTISPECIES: hypothetical protein [unclassified Acidovorax]KRC19143.1 hypothetical protein ASE31_05790 [Acidovorax sp. Root217]KRC20130.1 hypothetical protein ASE28_27955 [Acidovorax sp. Root219]MDP4074579.1 hypothetical protein [Acidovorax sp. A1169]